MYSKKGIKKKKNPTKKKKAVKQEFFFYYSTQTWKRSRMLEWNERRLFQMPVQQADGESRRLPPEDTASTILFI